jgi:hypothetical protein
LAGAAAPRSPRRVPAARVGADVASAATRELTPPTQNVAEPTLLMTRPTRAMPAEGRAGVAGRRTLALVALATVVVALVALFAFTGGSNPGRARAAKHTSTSTTQARRHPTTTASRPVTTADTTTAADTTTTADTTATTTSTPTTNTNASAPGSVSAAVTSLDTLLQQDVQAGTVSSAAASAIGADAQQIATAAGNDQTGQVITGFVQLAGDLSGFARQGDVSPSALPAIDLAVTTLTSALRQSQVAAATTQTTAVPGQQQPVAGPHHGGFGGVLPPGLSKKFGGR